MVSPLHAGSASRRFPIGAISVSCFLDPACGLRRIAYFRFYFRQNLSGSSRTGRGSSLFSRNARQSFGGSLAGYFLGALLDRSWSNYFYFMAPFGIIGGVLMLSILGRVSLVKQPCA